MKYHDARILLTNLQKCARKILFTPQSETFSSSQDFCLNLIQRKKYIFAKHLWRLVNKMRKQIHVQCITSCKITARTDKFCGNESKLRMTSQNYKFVQCIFLLTSIINVIEFC